MSRKSLHQLGYDVQRLRIMLRQSDWKYLQDWADSTEGTLADAAALFIGMMIDQRCSRERVMLTPLGEQAADGDLEGCTDHNLRTGGA